jgi:hypothetical protein
MEIQAIQSIGRVGKNRSSVAPMLPMHVSIVVGEHRCKTCGAPAPLSTGNVFAKTIGTCVRRFLPTEGGIGIWGARLQRKLMT